MKEKVQPEHKQDVGEKLEGQLQTGTLEKEMPQGLLPSTEAATLRTRPHQSCTHVHLKEPSLIVTDTEIAYLCKEQIYRSSSRKSSLIAGLSKILLLSYFYHLLSVHEGKWQQKHIFREQGLDMCHYQREQQPLH